MAAIAKNSPRRAIQEIIHGQRRVLGTREGTDMSTEKDTLTMRYQSVSPGSERMEVPTTPSPTERISELTAEQITVLLLKNGFSADTTDVIIQLDLSGGALKQVCNSPGVNETLEQELHIKGGLLQAKFIELISPAAAEKTVSLPGKSTEKLNSHTFMLEALKKLKFPGLPKGQGIDKQINSVQWRNYGIGIAGEASAVRPFFAELLQSCFTYPNQDFTGLSEVYEELDWLIEQMLLNQTVNRIEIPGILQQQLVSPANYQLHGGA